MKESLDGRFPTTHWTLIQRLKSEDAQVSTRALEDLCRQYHYPLYCYIRRRGLDHHDAEDALHDFLAKLLRLDSLQDTEEARGRLRGFLCTSLHRFLINWHESRRNSTQRVKSLEDLSESEKRYQMEHLTDADTPERIFNRKWSQELLKRVLESLDEDYQARGKSADYQALKPILLSGGSLRGYDTQALSQSLSITEGTLRIRLHRLLKDYRTLLRNEVLQTVGHMDQVEDEISHLMAVFQK